MPRGHDGARDGARYGGAVTLHRRTVPHVALSLAAALALAGCAGLTGGTEPADRAAVAARSEPAGIAPELVYVTDIEGFRPAPQSVGVMGDDGMSVAYVGSGGGAVGTVMLTTARTADPAAVACDALPEATGPAASCVVTRDEATVLLEAADVDAATLRAAAETVRVPTERELDELFAEAAGVPDGPVERGDLPPGDGAPVDEPGVGG